MNCLIIEDEYPAAQRLQALLQKVAPEVQVAQVLESVQAAKNWLQTQPAPDLILSDIQLADGLSFEIYEALQVACPIIFTTAYDEYAIKAFKLRSIDYLLKPIKPQELRAALDKFRDMKTAFASEVQAAQLATLQALLQQQEPANPTYKRRFLVQSRDQLLPVQESEIAYFVTAHELVYLVRMDGKRFAIEGNMEELSRQLDPNQFFRLNRQYIGHLRSIERIHPYFNGRLKLQLAPDSGEEVIVSRDKARSVKQWLGE
jgi:DNA-binding LytR/AlgR family response regulator